MAFLASKTLPFDGKEAFCGDRSPDGGLYVPEGTLVQNEDMAVSFALLSNRLAKTMRTGPEEA